MGRAAARARARPKPALRRHAPRAERWLSGRKHRTRNAAYGQPYRGFESHPLRHATGQLVSYKGALRQAPAISAFGYGDFGHPPRLLRLAAAGRAAHLAENASPLRPRPLARSRRERPGAVVAHLRRPGPPR